MDMDIVTTEGEEGVMANLRKKQMKADAMFAALVAEMHRGAAVDAIDRHINEMEVPSWLV